LPGTLGEPGKPDASAARVIAPHYLATAMNVTLGFRQIEAKRYGPVHLQPFTGLDGEALFVQVEQFAQIHNHPGLRPIETGVNRCIEFLTNTAPSLSAGRRCTWIRQSKNALIHGFLHINSRIERKGARSIGEESNGLSKCSGNYSPQSLVFYGISD
jgi:hypothetical protein